MQIQKDSWKHLDTHLPCSSCVKGKFQKRHRAGHVFHTDIQNLAVSRTSGAEHQPSIPNECVSTDWGIVNKPDRHGNTVFALYLDENVGSCYGYQAPARSLAAEPLKGYIQNWGVPKKIKHDNASEYTSGEFPALCRQYGIKQIPAAPYSPNFNPVELYMDVLVCTARSLLATSGLNTVYFWGDALAHAVQLQNVTALPGRCTPRELAVGRRPDVSHLRAFGCKSKRDCLAYSFSATGHNGNFVG